MKGERIWTVDATTSVTVQANSEQEAVEAAVPVFEEKIRNGELEL